MSLGWLVLSVLLQGASSFMIYSNIHFLCLQDVPKNNTVQLKRCDVAADVQQWLWKDQRMLVNKVTKRCLSTHQVRPVLTVPCDSSHSIWWNCRSHRLISHNDSLELTTDGRGLFLSGGSNLSKWWSLEIPDICKERQRFRRGSNDHDYSEAKGEDYEITDKDESMTDEQREYLRWYYRTEDALPWKYSILALSSVSLLIGCVVLVKDVVDNRTKKKTMKDKSVSLKTNGEELQIMTDKKGCSALAQESEPSSKPFQDDHNTAKLKMGNPAAECEETNGPPLQLREEDV